MNNTLVRFAIVGAIGFIAVKLFGPTAVFVCLGIAALYHIGRWIIRLIKSTDWRAVRKDIDFGTACAIVGTIALAVLLAIAVPGIFGFQLLSNALTLQVGYWCIGIILAAGACFGVIDAKKQEAARAAWQHLKKPSGTEY